MSPTTTSMHTPSPADSPAPSPGAAVHTAPDVEPHDTGSEAVDWHQVCLLEDLEPMWGEAALIEGTQIALVRLEGETVHAVSQWDPYACANVMSRGIVGSKAGRPTLASPIHKQPYDLATGQCLSDEALKLESFPVRILAGVVEVKV